MPDPLSTKDNGHLWFLHGSASMADNDGRRQLPIMVRQAKKSQKPDWPFMELWGLHRRSIEADGV